MASELLQPAFVAGEISSDLYGRVDLEHFLYGVRLARNFFLDYHGGLSNRGGMQFIAEAKHHDKKSVFIPFTFSTVQTYALEFGDGYMRVHKDGGLVLEANVAISAITQANPAKVTTSSAHGYSTGDHIYISGVEGMISINGGPYTITVTSTTEFTLDGVDSTGFEAYTTGGNVARVYEIVSPYAEADLIDADGVSLLKYTQSADVLTITHPDFDQREVTRTGHTSWSISTPGYANTVAVPSGVALSRSDFDLRTISNITQANPAVVTLNTASVYSNGDQVFLREVGGMTEIIGGAYTIQNKIGDTFELQGIDSTGYSAFTSGGYSSKVPSTQHTAKYKVTAVVDGEESLPSTAKSIDVDDPWPDGARVEITWNNVTNADKYVVYANKYGFWGFIGEAADGTEGFVDDNIRPEVTDTPPSDRDPFSGANEKPQTVTYHQQRIVFGGADDWPAGLELSRIGFFDNFSKSAPPKDDDAISYSIVSQEVNEIRHLVSLGNLIALTSGGEWVLTSGESVEVTPATVGADAQSYHGASHVRPLVIGNTALFIQDGGRTVRDLAYSLDVDGFQGTDLTVRASHLTRGRQIVSWCYAKEPYRLVWAALDNGTLLTLTYVRDQKVWAWTQHETDGAVESLCAIREGNDDNVYAVVRRTIGGATKRYVERIRSREYIDIRDAFHVDSGLSYDGRNTDTAKTLTLSGGSSWAYWEQVTLTLAGDTWTSTIVDDEFRLRTEDSGGETVSVRVLVLTHDSSTTATVRLLEDCPSELQAQATSDWDRAVDAFAGLDHLEGETLNVLADGNVEPQPTVSSGRITLERHAAVVHAGLPYNADVESLDVEISDGRSTVRTRRKLTGKVSLLVKDTRGLFLGQDVDNLVERKPTYPSTYNDPIKPVTGIIEANVSSRWSTTGGRFYARQSDPLPCTILSAMPEVTFGG